VACRRLGFSDCRRRVEEVGAGRKDTGGVGVGRKTRGGVRAASIVTPLQRGLDHNAAVGECTVSSPGFYRVSTSRFAWIRIAADPSLLVIQSVGSV
jgi:hypothetical protein